MNILLKGIKAIVKEDGLNKVILTDICIEGNKIKSIGNIPEGFKADKIIDGTDKLAMPGLINSHTHCYMTFMRNLADDVPFIEWLTGIIDPIEDAMTTEETTWGTKLGLIEMIKTGTTCFNDMNIYKCDDVPAIIESGMRAVITTGLVGETEDDEAGMYRLNKTLENAAKAKDCDRISYMIGPHAPYSCSKAFYRTAAKKAKELNCGIHTHLSESDGEMAMVKEAYGCSPIKEAMDGGLFDVRCIAAHCVKVSDEDLDILKKYDVSVASNPVSNMKLGNGFAPVKKMLDKGINVCLGTDGAASNNALNMFREMNAMTLIHKGNEKLAECVSAQEVLDMATINGAKALGLENEIGSLSEGKKADIAILDLNNSTLQPENNLISALAYSANGSEVDTVIIDGNIVMENRKLLTINEKEVYEHVNAMLPQIVKRLEGNKKDLEINANLKKFI